MSKQDAWAIVKTMGTPRQVETGAYLLARGRFADVERLALRITR